MMDSDGNEIFARVLRGTSPDQIVAVLRVADGSPATRITACHLWPIRQSNNGWRSTGVSARYDHAEGITLYATDARRAGIAFESEAD